jgi:DNA repair protein RecN (Recombination protein N)
LRPCEEEELVSERARLANAELLARDAAVGYLALAGNDDAIDDAGALPSLRQAAHAFGEIVTLDPSTEPLKERLDEMLFSLEDLAAEVRTYRDLMEADPTRLGVVDERLAELRQLKRKYGADVEAVLRHAELAQTELERLTESEMDADELAAREVELGVEAGRVGWQLSQRRADAGRKLAAEIESSIAQLNMGSAAFSVALEHVEDPDGVPVANGARTAIYSADGSGIDRVSFMIAPNAGEGLKPLSRIASGGETARLMLALKSILSEADQTPTLLFDEIDVGVGGRSGQVVGEKLWGLATGHQVIVITHLPQIAAFADQHFQISKVESAQRVSSTVAQLDEDERVREIAAMLDGVPITETSLRSAEEMIERAKALKHQRAAS